jgi:hypothetical protein
VKLTKCQNHHHHGGVFDMWTKWGQTPGQVRPGASRPRRVFGSSTRNLVATCLHEEEKPESMEAAPLGRSTMWPGCPATSWLQTDLSKSVEIPFTPISTPPHSESRHTHTHTPHFGDFTCKALIFSVVARHSLVGRVARL